MSMLLNRGQLQQHQGGPQGRELQGWCTWAPKRRELQEWCTWALSGLGSLVASTAMVSCHCSRGRASQFDSPWSRPCTTCRTREWKQAGDIDNMIRSGDA